MKQRAHHSHRDCRNKYIPGCLIFTGISMVYYFWWVNHWEGIGLDGQTKSTLLTISQAGYQLRASSELSTLGVLPQGGGIYNLNIKLTPTDVPIPAGNLYVQVVYSGEQISVSDKVETASNTYSYPISITIPANNNPSLIGITVYIILEREAGAGIAISSLSIDQKGTK